MPKLQYIGIQLATGQVYIQTNKLIFQVQNYKETKNI